MGSSKWRFCFSCNRPPPFPFLVHGSGWWCISLEFGLFKLCRSDYLLGDFPDKHCVINIAKCQLDRVTMVPTYFSYAPLLTFPTTPHESSRTMLATIAARSAARVGSRRTMSTAAAPKMHKYKDVAPELVKTRPPPGHEHVSRERKKIILRLTLPCFGLRIFSCQGRGCMMCSCSPTRYLIPKVINFSFSLDSRRGRGRALLIHLTTTVRHSLSPPQSPSAIVGLHGAAESNIYSLRYLHDVFNNTLLTHNFFIFLSISPLHSIPDGL